MAHMIPAEPKEFDARSHEGVVFEALKKLPDSYYVFHSVETVDSKEGQWIISIKNNGMASISNAAYTNRLLQYNQNSPRFATYTGSQKAVSIYCKANSTTAINKVVTQTNGHYNVYNAHGQLIRRSTTISQALSNLSQGIYVVNGKKILIK